MSKPHHPSIVAALLSFALALGGCGDNHDDLSGPVPANTGGHDAGMEGGASCETNADCADGQECKDLTCVPIATCHSSLDCPLGEVCDTAARRCVECLSDDDCGDARCVGQVCRSACDSDNDCTPHGQLCDKANGYCVECLEHKQCSPNEHCASGACKTDACKAGTSSCDGAAIVTCDSVGSGYEVPVPCGTQKSCTASGGFASCNDWVCTPEVVFCTAAEQAARCAADGLSHAVITDCGAAQQVCVAGACAEVVCAPGQQFCSGNAVHQCSAKGDASTVYATCTATQYCDAGTASCMAMLCTPLEPVCSGTVATTCNGQGSGFQTGGVDCASSGLVCSQGACKAQVCNPNSEFCDAGSVRRCASDGLSSNVVQACSATQFCNPVTATCDNQVCVPAAPVCNNTVATTCNTEGSGYVSGGTNCAASGQVCYQGACATMVCTPGSLFCENGHVHRCSNDGLSSSLYLLCASGEYCDDVAKLCLDQVCTPNQPACDGNTATTCNTDGSGYLPGGVACGVQHCSSGSCTNALFVEDFEDGDYVGWTPLSTTTTQSMSSSITANGTSWSLLQSKLSSAGVSHYEGLYRTVPTLKPQSISWWARQTQTDKSGTYFVLCANTAPSDRLVAVYFRSTGLLRLYVDSTTSYDVPYTANQWYHLELRNINWSTRTFDYYIDGALVHAGVPLMGAGVSVSRIDLYHYDAGASGYWDEIEFK